MKRSNLIKLLAALSLLMAAATFLVARPATPAVAKGLLQTTTTMTLTQTVNKPTGIMPGDTLVYQYYVKNTGATTATAVSLSDTLPSQLSLVNTQADKGLMQSAWPMFHQNPQHTGRSIHYGPITNTVRCTYNIGSVIASSPAIAQDGTVYVGADDGKLYAFTPNCALKWSYTKPTTNAIKSSPAIASDGTIYFGADDDYLYAINPNGSLKWRHQTVADVRTPPTIDGDGTIYAASNSWGAGAVHAVKPDGSLKWKTFTYYYTTGSPVIAKDGMIYFSHCQGGSPNVFGVSSDGMTKWTASELYGGSTFCASPAVASTGEIYFSSVNGGKLVAFNTDLTVKWRYSATGGELFNGPAIGLDGTIYVGGYANRVYAISSNNTEKWAKDILSWSSGSSPAVDASGTIYIGSNGSTGGMYAINSSDGSLKWKYIIGSVNVESSPAIGPDGTIYFGSDNGTFYGVGPGQAGVPENPWTVSLGSIAPNETRIITVTIQVSNSTTTGSIINNTATVMSANSTTVNDTHVITIALDPPTLNAITSPDSDGNYPITWNSVSGATSYTLERDDNAGFTTPEVAYTGSLTTHNEASRAPGTWYYRVKASNAGGDSAWSNTVSAEVITPPQANFQLSPLTAEVNQTIYFTNTSVGSYTTVLYDFGDNTVSGSSNATHSYTNTGTKIITLTVSGYATSSTISKSVTIGTACTASFTLDRTDGPAPLTVTATDTSTGDCPTSTWHWGEGLVTSLLTHTYNTTGNFTVMLTKTGGMGTVVTQSNIVVYPRAQATMTAAPVTGEVPLTVTFTSRMTDVVSFAWNFGDGSPVETFLTNPTHVYTQGGNFNATLTVTGTGTGNSASQTVVITPTSTLKPLFTFTSPSGIVPPDAQICFNNDSTPVDAASSWNFGDGSLADTNRNTCHFYKTAGIYTVILTISKDGQSAFTSTTVPIYQKCAANFSYSPSLALISETVQFTNTTTGDCNTALWSFGDGSSSTQISPSHAYTQAGTFPVKLIMTGNGGTSELVKQTVVTTPTLPMITANPSSGDAQLTVQFGLTGNTAYPQQVWNFDDGTTSTQASPIHDFFTSKRSATDLPLPYIVTATLTGQKGSLILTRPITVTQAPDAYFKPSPVSGLTPLTVTMNNSSTGDIASYFWDFGNGQTSTEKNPPAQIYGMGKYTITLTVTGVSGKTDSHAETITVYEPCVAKFNVTGVMTTTAPPLQLNVKNNSTHCTAFAWEFGNGVRSDLFEPDHFYTRAGKFTLKLTATGPVNSDTATGPTLEVGNPICEIDPATVSLTPTQPQDNDPLIIHYVFVGCRQQRQQIAEGVRLTWWQNGKPVTTTILPLNPSEISRTLPASLTLRGQTWQASVTPFKDGVEGTTIWSREVYIVAKPNTPPTATVTLSPANPTDDDSLTLSYAYHDADGDAEDVSQLRYVWYLDNQLQPKQTTATISADETHPQEAWCGTVQVHDGIEYSVQAPQVCVNIGTGKNHAPQVLGASLMQQRQNIDGILRVTGIYSDVDLPCTYCGQLIETLPLSTVVEIQWFRDNNLQPEFNNQTQITRSVTFTGELWHATIQVNDGLDKSIIMPTAPINLIAPRQNTPPQATNLRIVALDAQWRTKNGAPEDSDHLQLEYDFIDPDGDSEQGSFIYWYTPLTKDDKYDGWRTIPASETQSNQSWYARVIPCDGQGGCGDEQAADSVQIQPDGVSVNTPPILEDVRLVPSSPAKGEALNLERTFKDADGDIEKGTEIVWSINGQPDPDLNGKSKIPAGIIRASETWCVEVKPKDGRGLAGIWYGLCVTSLPSSLPTPIPPRAENPYLSSANLPNNQVRKPADSENLELHYTFIDDDCMETAHRACEHDSQIRWYRDGVLLEQNEFKNLTVVSATKTAPGQKWYATIRPHDGQVFGVEVKTDEVIINHPPVLNSVSFMPMLPNPTISLTAICDYTDADNDPASSLAYSWSRNGSPIDAYDNQPSLPPHALHSNETWTVSCTVHDGIEAGNTLSSTVKIGLMQTYLPLIMKPALTTATPTATPTAPTATPSTPIPTNTPVAFEVPVRCNVLLNQAEPNNYREEGCPLEFNQSYTAYPNDHYDYYSFTISETMSVKVEISSYTKGYLRIYDSFNTQETLLEQPINGSLTVPNPNLPNALVNLYPGRYTLLIDTTSTSTNTLYNLTLTALPKRQ